MDAKLTKQHYSTRIYVAYFWYLDNFFPHIDKRSLCEEAGLPYEYVSNHNNWVSVRFDAKFTRLCMERTGCKDLCFKVGEASTSGKQLGTIVHVLAKYTFSTNTAYKNLARFTSYFNKTVNISLTFRASGRLVARVSPCAMDFDNEEKAAFRESLSYAIENIKGYVTGAPTLHGGSPARVRVNEIETENGTVYELEVSFKPEAGEAHLWLYSAASAVLFYGILSKTPISEKWYCLLATLGPCLSALIVLALRYKRLRESLRSADAMIQHIDSQYSALQTAKENLSRKYQESQLVSLLTNNLTKSHSQQEVLEQSCKDIVNVLSFDRALILIRSKDGDKLVFGAAAGDKPEVRAMLSRFSQPVNIPSDDPRKISNVFRTGAPFIIANVQEHLATLNQESQMVLKLTGSTSFLCVPIASESTTHGVLCVDYYESGKTLTEDDLNLMLSVGRQIALALDKEQAQEASIEAMKQADKIKDEFLANTSHELRTPLNGIIGLAESLAQGAVAPMPEPATKSLHMIVQSGKRLCGLVNDILDFSKIRNNELRLETKAVGVAQITEVTFALLAPLLRGKSVELKMDLPADLPYVNADEDRLQQIMLNLVGNAIKFTDSGHVRVSGRVVDKAVEVCVEDTGIGISEEFQKKLFSPFQQEDGSSKRRYGGTGLGLSITKKLIELQSGSIWADSKPGGGTKFYFTIPCHDGVVNQERVAPAKPAVTKTVLPAMEPVPKVEVPTSGKYQILIVDDDPINLQVLINQLGHHGYRILEASTGQQAIDIVNGGIRPDLILLDVMMPGMTGFEACAKLRETLPVAEVPIIFLTAKNQPSDIVTGLGSGANDYLTKPFSRDELLARIGNHLALAKTVNSYCRFVPFEFIKLLGHESILEVDFGDHKEKEMAVLFSDIRGFTSIAEKQTPMETFQFLNGYFACAAPIINQHGGFIDKYIGDGMMAIFADGAKGAILAAAELNKALRQARHLIKGGVRTGIGINSGKLILGTIGYEKQMQGTVISDVVNTASRLESLTKDYGVSIAVGEATIGECGLGPDFGYRRLGEALVKGKSRPVSVVEIFRGEEDTQFQLKRKSTPTFELGVKAYLEKQYLDAQTLFEQVVKENPEDLAARRYLALLTDATEPLKKVA